MDTSSGMGGGNAFGDGLTPWPQQVDYQGIKVQQNLPKQPFVSPIPSPEHYPAENVKAAPGAMAPQAQDFADLEKLSSNYQPPVQGPLIGNVTSSRALELEYANADPAFVRKTRALSPKYTHYRTVLGDGNCGWRAVAFGYFELLLRTGDVNRIGMEHARIASLNGLMSVAGFLEYLYEDFAGVTFDLFRKLQSSEFLDNPHDDSKLLDAFTEPGVSDAIITHFKFLTSAWMKTRPDYYQPFLSQPVKGYCELHIEPYAIEIDHVGLMALIDVLVLPAEFGVEVFYLDRSEGDEVNVHRFHNPVQNPEKTTPNNAVVLRLLYRPGHYDIIYKKGEIPENETPLQVSFLPTLPEQHFASTPLALFPHIPSLDRSFFQSEPGPSNFRPSVFNLPAFQPSLQSLPFQTTTFRNSPFNPSHFQSENFQPEIYQPPTSSSSSSKRHSSERQNTATDTWGSDDGGQYPTSPGHRQRQSYQ